MSKTQLPGAFLDTLGWRQGWRNSLVYGVLTPKGYVRFDRKHAPYASQVGLVPAGPITYTTLPRQGGKGPRPANTYRTARKEALRQERIDAKAQA